MRDIVSSPSNLSIAPAATMIISLYNAEKYISKCFDSLLNQTFQNFEVLAIDDCSTDNSLEVIKSYAQKFNGRLKIAKTKAHSGDNYVLRNIGIKLSSGEYIQFLNVTDMLTKTAIEELNTLAKNFDADVVSCEKYYETTDGTDIRAAQAESLVDKPTLEPEDLRERLQNIADGKYSLTVWNKLVRRNFLAENELLFPAPNDDIWIYGLIFFAKKFLRVPNAVYIRRMSETSELEMTPQQQINSELKPVLLDLKALDNLMSRHEFFAANPDCRFALLKNFIDMKFNRTIESAWKMEEDVIYSTIKETFGEKLGDYNILIPALCAALCGKKISAPLSMPRNNKKNRESDAEILAKFKRWFSIRLDIQLKTANKEDFKIISVSDDRAEIRKPEWFNRNGVGYVIQSYAGKLTVGFKIIDGGAITLNLKGLFYSDPKNKGKRIPYWVDYTKFAVNDKIIFNKLTPIWHDKPYTYTTEAKAGEEFTVNVEWLPHRGDT